MKMEQYLSALGQKEYLKKGTTSPLNRSPLFDGRIIYVDPTKKKQTMLGFGGALTESAAYLYSLLGFEQKTMLLKAYFTKEGANYTYGRLSINSSDFGFGNYDYLDGSDESLESFSLKHEEKYLLPFLSDIEKTRGRSLFLMASPWSPCAFMKDNRDMNHGGRLEAKYRPLWAKYEAKYFTEMRKKGHEFEIVTVQNEPEANQTWDSCLFSSEEEAAYIPFLRAALDEAGFKKIGIYIWDHNRDEMVRRSNATLSDPEIDQMVSGIAYHWYCSNNHKNVSLTHELHPDKHLIFSEGCVELTNPATFKEGVVGSWGHGEIYGENMIEDFNNYSEGWIDWNVLLDGKGGPNHKGNYCEAPVMFNLEKRTLVFNPSFYFICHFSRFIERGAKGIHCQNDYESGVHATAMENPDGSLIVVVMNESGKETEPLIDIKNIGGVKVSLPPHSITTYRLLKGGK